MNQTAMSSLESVRRTFFMNSTNIMSKKQESNVSGSGSRNQSNSHELARIGERKTFHETDVHHVLKSRNQTFCAQKAKMSLTANSWLESARRKFFIDSAYIISRK